MKFLNILTLFLLMFLFTFSTIKAKNYKIIILNGTSYNNVYTALQENGFINYIKNNVKQNDIKIEIKSIYIDVKKVNIHLINEYILSLIYSQNPNLLYITNEKLCNDFGIKLSKSIFTICSNITYDFLFYKKKYFLTNNKNRMVFIRNVLNIDKLFNFLSDNYIFINYIYIIVEPNRNMSDECFNLIYKYKKYLKHNFKVYYYEVYNVYNLIDLLNKLNKKETGLIFPFLQKIKDENGKERDILYINKIINKYNKKHIDVGFSKYFCKNNIAICVTPDFYSMGEKCGDIAISYFFDNETNYGQFYELPTKIIINKEKLNRLGFKNILNNIENLYNIY